MDTGSKATGNDERESIKIIVGGPPHSGKSTFAECIARALQDQGIDAENIDLDEWSPTRDYIRGKITWEQREEQKRQPVTKERIEQAVERFNNAAKKHHVVIGDAPGKISEDSRPLFQSATHGIIVCREDEFSQIDNWKKFYSEIGVPLVAIVISKTSGKESVSSSQIIEAELVGLERERLAKDPRPGLTFDAMAVLLRSVLGI